MAKIVVNGNTVVRQVVVGTPIRSIQSQQVVSTSDVSDFIVDSVSNGDFLIYDSDASKYRTGGITAGAGINVTYSPGAGSNIEVAATSNVPSGTYGSEIRVPVISVDANGLIDSIGTVLVSVAGADAITDIDYDSATGVLTVTTGDASTYTTTITLDAFTTDDLSEGSLNKYYTSSRVDSDITALVDSAYIQRRQADIFRDSGFVTNIIDSDYISRKQAPPDLTLYATRSYVETYVIDRVDSAINDIIGAAPEALNTLTELAEALGNDSNFSTTITNSIAEKFSTDKFDSYFDSAFSNKTTDDITEGSNLYYTDTRAREALSIVDAGGDGSFSYDNTTGVFTYTGPSEVEVRAHFTEGASINIEDGRIQLDSASVVKVAGIQTDKVHTTDSGLRVYGNILPSEDSTYSLGDSNHKWKSLYVSGGTIFLGTVSLSDDGGTFTSTTRTGEPAPISLAGNNTNDLSEGDSNLYYRKSRVDSDFNNNLSRKTTSDLEEGSNLYYTEDRIIGFVDSAYVQQRQTNDSDARTFIRNYVTAAYIEERIQFKDSLDVTSIVDSDYIIRKITPTAEATFVDSNQVRTIVDSAYVQARQRDVSIDDITPLVDSAYIQRRQVDIFRDSGFVTNIVDAAYIQARQVDIFRDSAFITHVIDSTYVKAFIDSTYVAEKIAHGISVEYVQLDSSNPADTSNKLYTQNGHLYWNGASLDSAGVGYIPLNKAGDTMTGDLTINKSTPRINLNDAADGGIELSMAVLGEDFYIFEPEDAGGTQVPSELSGGKAWVSIIDSTETLSIFGYKVWTQGNDGALSGLDADLLDGFNGTYYLDWDNFTNKPNVLDSDNVLNLISRNATDSSTIRSFVDSAYVQQRQNLTYASLTGKPTNVSFFTNDAGYITAEDATDSAAVIALIQANTIDSDTVKQIVDSAYINARIGELGIDSDAVKAIIDSNYIRERQADIFRDSSFITEIIDSSYVQARQNFSTAEEIIALFDSDFIRDRTLAVGKTTYIYTGTSAQTRFTDSDDNDNVLSYNNGQAQIDVYRNGIKLVGGGVDYTANNDSTVDFVKPVDAGDTIIIDVATLYGSSWSNYIENIVDSGSGAKVTGDLHVTGLLTADSISVTLPATGVVAAQYGATTRVAIITVDADGRISDVYDDDIDFPDNLSEFANDVGYATEAYVDSYIGIINAAGYATESYVDSYVQLLSDSIANLKDDITSRGYLVASDLSSYATQTYVNDAIDSIVGAAPGYLDTINELAAAIGNDSNFSVTVTNSIATKLAKADFGTYFDSHFAIATTDDLTEGASNLYYTDDKVRAVIDSAYVNARVGDTVDSAAVISLITANTFDSDDVKFIIDSAYVAARVDAGTDSAAVISLITSNTFDSADIVSIVRENSLDSTTVTSVVDSAYVQARQITYDFLDSAEVINLIDSAYVQARQITYDFLDSSEVEALIDSDYIISKVESTDLNLNVVEINKIEEKFDITASISSSPHTFDTEGKALHFVSAISTDITAAFTNVNSTSGQSTTVTVVIDQGATPYDITAVTVNGSAVSIYWPGGVVTAAVANMLSIYSFTIMRVSSSWYVIGSISNHST